MQHPSRPRSGRWPRLRRGRCGHSRSTEPEQHPVNPLDSASSTATATYHQHHPVASCKPRTGARLPERYKGTHEGAAVFYQRNDGQSGKHWRNLDMRRNPGVTGDGWQVRRFDPVDPSSATALCLTEGEKDAAQLSAAGLIAFTAPRGAQSLPGADFTELVALAKETHLPILLSGDNDEVGRKAMRQVRRQLQPVGVPEPLPYPITGWKRTKNHSHLDVTDLTGRAPEKGSIADLPQPELHKLLGLLLQDLDERMVKPVRSRMMYREYWCPHPKRQQRAAGDDQNIMTFLPVATRQPAKSVATGKTSSTSKGVGGASPLRWLWCRASVGLTQPLLKRWGWPRFTGGAGRTDCGKLPPLTSIRKTPLVNGGSF